LSVREDTRGMAERLVKIDAWPDEGSGEKPSLSEAWYPQFGKSEHGKSAILSSKIPIGPGLRAPALQQMHRISCAKVLMGSPGERPTTISVAGNLTNLAGPFSRQFHNLLALK